MNKAQITPGEVLERIESHRQARGSTKTHLMKTAGITPSTYYRIERGESHMTVDQLIAIADALGITPSELTA